MQYRGLTIKASTVSGRAIGYTVPALRQGYATLALAQRGIDWLLWYRARA